MRKKALTVLKRLAILAFLALIAMLIFNKAREMDWPEVLNALTAYSAGSIATAFALAVPAYLACSTFDLIGRHVTGHRLTALRTSLISFTGYFFSLNLGALVGGLAFRYRLYMRYGLSGMTISQIIGLSVVTNWSGYVVIAGAVMAYEPPQLPAGWEIGSTVLRVTGVLLLAAACGYVVLCITKGGSTLELKGIELKIPSIGVAGAQFTLSVMSWGSIGAVITWLLGGEVSWFAVMPVLMMSAIAGIWSHIPSGLGVTEVVFLSLLGHVVPDSRLLAAVLVFRLTYYVVPFVLAALAYLYLEATAKRTGSAAPAS